MIQTVLVILACLCVLQAEAACKYLKVSKKAQYASSIHSDYVSVFWDAGTLAGWAGYYSDSGKTFNNHKIWADRFGNMIYWDSYTWAIGESVIEPNGALYCSQVLYNAGNSMGSDDAPSTNQRWQSTRCSSGTAYDDAVWTVDIECVSSGINPADYDSYCPAELGQLPPCYKETDVCLMFDASGSVDGMEMTEQMCLFHKITRKIAPDSGKDRVAIVEFASIARVVQGWTTSGSGMWHPHGGGLSPFDVPQGFISPSRGSCVDDYYGDKNNVGVCQSSSASCVGVRLTGLCWGGYTCCMNVKEDQGYNRYGVGGSTETGNALAACDKLFESAKPDAKLVAILLTDGAPTSPNTGVAWSIPRAALAAKGVNLIVAGVLETDAAMAAAQKTAWNAIAIPTGNVKLATSFAGLGQQTFVDGIVAEACPQETIECSDLIVSKGDKNTEGYIIGQYKEASFKVNDKPVYYDRSGNILQSIPSSYWAFSRSSVQATCNNYVNWQISQGSAWSTHPTLIPAASNWLMVADNACQKSLMTGITNPDTVTFKCEKGTSSTCAATPAVCSVPYDVCIAFDTSSSIDGDEFMSERCLLQKLGAKLGVDATHRVSFVQYGDTAKTIQSLTANGVTPFLAGGALSDFSLGTSAQSTSTGINRWDTGRGSGIGEGILGCANVLKSATGTPVMIVLTDGARDVGTTVSSAMSTLKAQNPNVRTVVAAVKDTINSAAQLNDIAAIDPKATTYTSFDSISVDSLWNQISDICDPNPPPPPPATDCVWGSFGDWTACEDTTTAVSSGLGSVEFHDTPYPVTCSSTTSLTSHFTDEYLVLRHSTHVQDCAPGSRSTTGWETKITGCISADYCEALCYANSNCKQFLYIPDDATGCSYDTVGSCYMFRDVVTPTTGTCSCIGNRGQSFGGLATSATCTTTSIDVDDLAGCGGIAAANPVSGQKCGSDLVWADIWRFDDAGAGVTDRCEEGCSRNLYSWALNVPQTTSVGFWAYWNDMVQVYIDGQPFGPLRSTAGARQDIGTKTLSAGWHHIIAKVMNVASTCKFAMGVSSCGIDGLQWYPYDPSQAGSFSGTIPGIDLTTTSFPIETATDFAITFRFNPSSWTGTNVLQVGKGSAMPLKITYSPTGLLTAQLQSSGFFGLINKVSLSTAGVLVDTVHTVGVSRKGSTAQLWVDGKLVATQITTGTFVAANPNTIFVGYDPQTASSAQPDFFIGNIDDVSIYSGGAGCNELTKCSATNQWGNLVAHFSFDGADPTAQSITAAVGGSTYVATRQSRFTSWQVSNLPCPALNVSGSQKSYRSVSTPVSNGGADCTGLDHQTRPCSPIKLDPCPVDCNVTAWTEYSNCSSTCGSGTKTRTRTISVYPSITGAQCPPTTDTQPCTDESTCPPECDVTTFADSTDCNATCGGGWKTQTRTVKCTKYCPVGKTDEEACGKSSSQIIPCAEKPCPTPCVMTNWTAWTTCDSVCGTGNQYSSRSVDKEPTNGGTLCPTDVSRQQTCQSPPCAANCTVGNFVPKTQCDKPCGGGSQVFWRNVTLNPGPGNFTLADCPASEEPRECNTDPCPVDCVMGPWENGTCTTDCGPGNLTQTRQVKVPMANNGIPCPESERVVPCDNKPCDPLCVTTTWDRTQNCSKPCGNGTRVITRSVTCTNCADNGLSIEQSCPTNTSSEPCNEFPCPVDCVYSDFSSWTPCSQPCGPGTSTQNRTIVTPSANNGAPCDKELVNSKPCQIKPCPVSCKFTDWTPTANCSVPCGGGTRPISRSVILEGTQTFPCTDGTSMIVNPFMSLDTIPGSCTAPAATENPLALYAVMDQSKLKPVPSVPAQTVTDGKNVYSWNAVTRTADAIATQQCGFAYFTTSVYSVAQDVKFSIKHIGAAVVWLNAASTPVYSSDASAGFSPMTSLALPSGWSTLVFRVHVDAAGSNLFAFQVTTPCQSISFANHEVNLDNAAECGATNDTEVCNPEVCPVDCVMTPWTNTTCSKPCGSGTLTSTRTVANASVGTGALCPLEVSKTLPCNEQPCDPTCDYTIWENTRCSKPCGGGEITYTRNVTCYGCKSLDDKKQWCPNTTFTIPCNEHPCPIDCVVSNWGDPSPCSETCGPGVNERTRNITVPDAYGGAACPELIQPGVCNNGPCSANCTYGVWQAGTRCNATCDGGWSTFTRVVTVVNHVQGFTKDDCEGSSTELRRCNEHPCPVDCIMSNWSAVGPCSLECGLGEQKWTRHVIRPEANQGDPCPVFVEKTESCSNGPCPPKCVYTDWVPGQCDKKCGGGIEHQGREVTCIGCNSSQPIEQICEPSERSITCNEQPCPVDCVMTDWSSWSTCSEECGPGTQTSSRTPKVLPQFNGTTCPTDTTKTQDCQIKPCAPQCNWTDWTVLIPCNVDCGTGIETVGRNLTVLNGSPMDCPGQKTDQRVCTKPPCPVDCVMTEWEKSGTCTATCGGGVQKLTRSVKTPAVSPGKACPVDTEKLEPCKEERCPVDCKYGTWRDSTACSVKCGGGNITQTRSVSCTGCYDGNATDVALNCPDTVQVVTGCSPFPCPVDCVLGDWQAWSNCSEPCGAGIETRKREVIVDQANGGLPCNTTIQSQPCMVKWCDPECIFSDFYAVGTCNVTCGGGIQKFRRDIRLNNTATTNATLESCGETEEERPCKTDPCDIPCKVGEYYDVGNCSKPCGGGEQKRHRNITQAPTGKEICPETDTTVPCNEQPCPPKCTRGEFLSQGNCSLPCGNGTVTQTRFISCDGCEPGKTEEVCGSSTRIVSCNEDPCPQDCVTTDWSQWSSCSVPCGYGTRTRTRNITSTEQNGGLKCPTDLAQTETCYTADCPAKCEYSTWQNSTKCDRDCGVGHYTLTRTVKVADSGVQYPCPTLPSEYVVPEFAVLDNIPTTTCIEAWSALENRDPISDFTKGATSSTRVTPQKDSTVGDPNQGTPLKWTSVTADSNSGMVQLTPGCYFKYFAFAFWSAAPQKINVRYRHVSEGWLWYGAPSSTYTRAVAEQVGDGSNVLALDVKAGWTQFIGLVHLTTSGSFSVRINGCTNGSALSKLSPYVENTEVGAGFRLPHSSDECPGELTMVDVCNTQVCPINCTVSDWVQQGNCSKPCGGGVVTWTRDVTQPMVGAGNPCPDLSKVEVCNSTPCPPTCTYSEFSTGSSCTLPCGGGTTTRTRTVSCENCPLGVDQSCESRTETIACNESPCPKNCTVTDWKVWGPCSTTCGPGLRTRYRNITQPSENGGALCPELTETGPCPNQPECNTLCKYGEWKMETNCTVACGGGTARYTRIVGSQDPNVIPSCTDTFQTSSCNVDPCPVDCVTSDWKNSSTCSATCGAGQQKQIRDITQKPSNNGRDCGVLEQYVACDAGPCPPQCSWSDWSPSTLCTVDCGGGVKIETRNAVCHNCESGVNTTEVCSPTSRTVTCNEHACPVDCIQSQWSTYSACSESCGSGVMTRNRSTILDAANGGVECGSSTETITCRLRECPPECVYGDWTSVGGCSAPCGGGTQNWTRTLTKNPSAENPFPVCVAKTSEVRPCKVDPCPVDCVVGDWVRSGECSKSCGTGGVERWYRPVDTPPQNGGISCPDLEKFLECNPGPCPPSCTYSEWVDATTCTNRCGEVGTKTMARTVTCYGCANSTELARLCDPATKTVSCGTLPAPVPCKVSPYGAMSTCDAKCGQGVSYATRSIVTRNSNGGASCPELIKSETCDAGPCDEDCAYMQFTPFGSCSVQCGGGWQTWKAEPWLTNRASCNQSLEVQRPCNTQPCGVDCVVSDWSASSPCSATCGGGMQTMTRSIITAPSGDGLNCPSRTQTAPCNEQACPPVCTTGRWLDTSGCDKGCGGGKKTQQRNVECVGCANENEKLEICGSTTRTTTCNLQPCIVDCQTSEWSAWGPCSQLCGEGIQYRSRSIIVEANGGTTCPSLNQSQSCTIAPCNSYCQYGAWKESGSCSRKCGGGQQMFTRSLSASWPNGTTVTYTEPTVGCPAALSEYRPCNEFACDRDCVMGNKIYGPCSSECGYATRTVTRTIVLPALGNGKPCEATSFTEQCTLDQCPPKCTVSDWSVKTPCSANCSTSCESGYQLEQRTVTCEGCYDVAKQCGPSERFTGCNQIDCPSDCVMTEWSSWGPCSVDCGPGTQTATRSIVQRESGAGRPCGATTKTQSCNAGDCPPTCSFTQFAPAESCSEVCGTGQMKWTRTVTARAPMTPETCGKSEEYRPCNTDPCPVDCEVSDWTQVDTCSKTCGTGETNFVRRVTKLAVGTGAACPVLQKTESCNTQPCPPQCIWGNWTTVGSCSQKCGGGEQTQIRNVSCVGCATPEIQASTCGSSMRTIECNTQPCPVDCVMSDYGAWSLCSEPCGPGFRNRTRKTETYPANGGAVCPSSSETQSCNLKDCPAICNYGVFQATGECSNPCGPGTQIFTRTVDSSDPTCTASTTETRPCNIKDCDVDCVVSDWQQSGSCSSTCGSGKQLYTRYPVTTAVGNGKVCPDLTKYEDCTRDPCPPVCEYGEWIKTTMCNATCGTGYEEYQRSVLCRTCTSRDETLVTCPDYKKTLTCNTQPCATDCEYSSWSLWSTCSEPCGDGFQTRTRTKVRDPSNGGQLCGSMEEKQSCNQGACPTECKYSDWVATGPCSKKCNGGQQGMIRQLTSGDPSVCVSPLTQLQPCNLQPCDVDCVLSEWVAVGQCSKLCGTGYQTSKRTILTSASGNGMPCDATAKTTECNTSPCTPECIYSDWSDATVCSVGCGGGLKTQTRGVSCANCDAGADIEAACGSSTQVVQCNTSPCSQDCKVSEWSGWSVCSQPCGEGTSTRTRSIDQDRLGDGAACPVLKDSKTCKITDCPPTCVYSDWAVDPIGCSKKCGGGLVTYTRTVNDPTCPASISKTVSCNEVPCDQDCEMSSWKMEGTCSATCGGGVQKFTRYVVTPQAGQGAVCPATSKTEDCNTQACPPTCEYGQWIATSLCTAKCGGGTVEYQRSVLCSTCTSQAETLVVCSDYKKTESCNADPCPGDCVMSNFTSWSSCSERCGKGFKTRTRTIISGPSAGGAACGPTSESAECMDKPCPSDCVYTEWQATGVCTVPCGGGEQTYARVVTRTGPGPIEECGSPSEVRKCNEHVCPVDCVVSFWRPGACSAECGPGEITSTRTIWVSPAGAGEKCPSLNKTETCEIKPCAPKCTYSEWTDIEACSNKCGGGVKKQTRTVYCPDCTDIDSQCGSSSRELVCNEQPCPVDCVVTDWTDWGSCSSTCGDGTKQRTRGIATLNAYSGVPCPALTEEMPCNAGPCPSGCVYGDWSSSGVCSSPCGSTPGEQVFTRTVTANPGTDVRTCGNANEIRACNNFPCPVDCVLGAWTNGACSKKCGGGHMTQERPVLVSPVGSGQPCLETKKFVACNEQSCDPGCKETEWVNKEACSVSCGGGKQTQTRTVTCDNCADANAVCGPSVRTVDCNSQACSKDCQMTGWTDWTACSQSCGPGVRHRSRRILSPAEGLGMACNVTVEEQECNLKPCSQYCVFASWFAVGSCSVKCGGGQVTYKRQISASPDAPVGFDVSADCGSGTEVRDCNPNPCDVDCELSDWSMQSSCSAMCDGGQQTFTREILTPSSGAGKPCDALTKVEQCNKDPCTVDCVKGAWQTKVACSANCGGGTKTEVRSLRCDTCSSEAETLAVCGPRERVVECNLQDCPRDCVMSDWQMSANCSANCGPATRVYTRYVVSPAAYNGVDCPTQVVRTEDCGLPPCTTQCTTTTWSPAGPCSVDCGTGVQTFRRNVTPPPGASITSCGATTKTDICTLPPCTNTSCITTDWTVSTECSATCGGGTETLSRTKVSGFCDGFSMESTRACAATPCTVVCNYGAWGDATPCSGECPNGGYKNRTRTVTCTSNGSPVNCGNSCPETSTVVSCNLNDCPQDCVYGSWSDWSPCTQPCGGYGFSERRRGILTLATEGGKLCTEPLYENQTCNTQACPPGCQSTGWSPQGVCSLPCGGGNVESNRPLTITPPATAALCGTDSQANPCNVQPCGVDCTVSDWTDSSECSKVCGGGTKTQTRTIVSPPQLGGSSCPALTRTTSCNPEQCRVKCSYGPWLDAAQCSKTCDGGTVPQNRTVQCTLEGTSTPCEESVSQQYCTDRTRTANCNEQACSDDCQFADWSSWSSCSATCGGGTSTRTREIISDATGSGAPCPGHNSAQRRETRECNTSPCDVNCVVSEFSEWTTCSEPCGRGTRSRSRNIVVPNKYNGAVCPSLFESEACFAGACPSKCIMTSFVPSGTCSKQCGGGLQTWTREINCTSCADVRSECGSQTEQRECNAQPCDTDCILSEWGDYGECSSTCGEGVRTRTREVILAPSGAGAPCQNTRETVVCNAGACPPSCNIGEFAMGGSCSKDCGTGDAVFTRTVTGPDADCGAISRTEVRPCNTQPCTRQCVVSDWSDWTSCDDPCGNGTESRYRNVLVSPVNAPACPGTIEYRECSNKGSNCPTDCGVFVDWHPVTECSSTCGGGVQRWERNMTGDPSVCGSTVQLRDCNPQPCDMPCVVSNWTDWGECSQPCGTGQAIRKRSIIRPAKGRGMCNFTVVETKDCVINATCPGCDYSEWVVDGCSKPCGGGTVTAARTVIVTSPIPGFQCVHTTEERACNVQACTNDCVVGGWSLFGECSATCGGGTQKATRALIAYGNNCPDLEMTQDCNTQPCGDIVPQPVVPIKAPQDGIPPVVTMTVEPPNIWSPPPKMDSPTHYATSPLFTSPSIDIGKYNFAPGVRVCRSETTPSHEICCVALSNTTFVPVLHDIVNDTWTQLNTTYSSMDDCLYPVGAAAGSNRNLLWLLLLGLCCLVPLIFLFFMRRRKDKRYKVQKNVDIFDAGKLGRNKLGALEDGLDDDDDGGVIDDDDD